MNKDEGNEALENRFCQAIYLDSHALLDHVLTLPTAPHDFDTRWDGVDDYRFFRFQRWLEETGTTLGESGRIVFLEKPA